MSDETFQVVEISGFPRRKILTYGIWDMTLPELDFTSLREHSKAREKKIDSHAYIVLK